MTQQHQWYDYETVKNVSVVNKDAPKSERTLFARSSILTILQNHSLIARAEKVAHGFIFFVAYPNATTVPFVKTAAYRNIRSAFGDIVAYKGISTYNTGEVILEIDDRKVRADETTGMPFCCLIAFVILLFLALGTKLLWDMDLVWKRV